MLGPVPCDSLHTGHETVELFSLGRIDIPDEKIRKTGQQPRRLLKADQSAGTVVLD